MQTQTPFDPKSIYQYGALQRWHQMVEKLNESQPVKTTTRRMPDGREITIIRKPKAVNSNEKATGERIIKDYIRDFMKAVQHLGDAAFSDGLPGLLTNSVEIGARRSCTDRTARTHVRKLQKIGLISQYKFRGSRHDFELWINPEILWTTPQTAVDDASESAPQTASIGQILKNFPHKVTVNHSNNETETIECSHVEHGDGLSAEALGKHGDDNHGNSERQQPKSAENEPERHSTPQGYIVSEGGAAGAAENGAYTARVRDKMAGKNPTKAPNPANFQRTDEQKRAILEGYLSSFWTYAKKVLYPSRSFQAYEEKAALDSIRRGVYLNFEVDITEKQWDQVQDAFYQRLNLVAKYYQRHTDKYIPEPFALYREGTGYFDAENLRGFRATESWLADNRLKYKRAYIQQRISAAIRQLHLHRAGRANKRLQAKSYLDAFKFLNESMSRYGQDAQARFQELASTIGQAKTQHVPGFNRNFRK